MGSKKEQRLAEIERGRQQLREEANTPENVELREKMAGGESIDFRRRSNGESTPPADDGDKKDLSDPQVQQDIMRPESMKIKLSWGETTFHKLTARQEVKFHGYALGAVGVAGQRPNNGNPTISLMMMNSVISEDDTLAGKLCYFAAISMSPPGKCEPKNAIILGAELFNLSKVDDYVAMYGVLSQLTGFDAVLTRYVAGVRNPKKDTQEATSTEKT